MVLALLLLGKRNTRRSHHRNSGIRPDTQYQAPMKRIFLIIVICGLCGCQGLLDKATGAGQSTGNKITVQPDTVYLGANGWTISYSPGMPKNPVSGNLPMTAAKWWFDFPNSDGVHMILVPYNALKPHKTLTITYRVSGTGKFVPSDPCSPNEVGSFRPMLERKGDQMVASQEFYRWWSTPTKLVADGQVHTVSYPLTPDKWTAVFGKGNASEFAATWNGNLMAVGISFGGCYAAHGVYVAGGKARFELLNYQIQ